ncbi:MAG TPA: thiol reductant ABC exporter subunit CydC [Firmicutes bacterium]|nr:thiol reductant ABC exporter subunit CydC [Bacillota bacterium]
MKTFRRLWRLVVPGWPRVSGVTLLGAATVFANVGLLATGAYLLSRAALRPPVSALMLAVVGVRFFALARAVARYAERLTAHGAAFAGLTRMRVALYQALEPLAPARLLQYRSGDLLRRLGADVETLDDFYLRALAPPAVALAVLPVLFVFLGRFASRLAWVFAAFYLVGAVGVPVAVGLLERGLNRRAVETRAALHAHLADHLQGLSELLVFDGEGRSRERAAALSGELARLQVRQASLAGLGDAFTGLTANLALWAVLAAAAPLVLGGRLAGTALAAVALAALGGFEAVAALSGVFPRLEASLAAGERVFSVLDTPPAVAERAEGTPVGRSRDRVRPTMTGTVPPGPPRHDLVVEGLRFRYDPAGPWVLDGLSLAVPEGGRVALVGPSGAGKTTLVHLLLRFWDYTEGSIRLGGRELREQDPEGVRRLFAVVSQRTHVFHATLRENLRLARPGANDAELVEAARAAQLHAFIQALPQGYDTVVGEDGGKLSGGQRQRLAIARALLKGAPFLILDEATSGLDPLTERELLQDIYRLAAGRTLLVITHRLVGLAALDEILVLQGGRVVERGSERDLLRADGLYRRLWERQHPLARV